MDGIFLGGEYGDRPVDHALEVAGGRRVTGQQALLLA